MNTMKPRNTGLSEEAAFDRFTDLMAKLMVKYGPEVLKRERGELRKAILDSVDLTSTVPPELVLMRLQAYQTKVDSVVRGMESGLKGALCQKICQGTVFCQKRRQRITLCFRWKAVSCLLSGRLPFSICTVVRVPSLNSLRMQQNRW